MQKLDYEQWLLDLESIEDEKDQKEFIQQTLEDKDSLDIFARFFFPEQVPDDVETAECHDALIHEIAADKDSSIIMPRGHGKTTWIRIDIIHDIVYNREPFIVLIGPTLTDAQQSFSFIKTQLEINQLLRWVYGDLVPSTSPKRRKKWNDKHFHCANGVVCIARGAGKGRGLNIGGNRPTKAILDDMEDKEKVKSDTQRKKLEDWFYQVVIPMMDKERGKIKMIGTVLHYGALVLKVYGEFGGIKRAAIEDEDGNPSLDGKPILFSMEKLMEFRKKMGSMAFSQEYMNDPRTDENSDVKLVWIQRQNSIRLRDKHGTMLWRIFSACDPATGKKQKNDETAIVSVAREIRNDDEVNIVVLSASHGIWGSTKTVEQANRVWNRYPHDKFGFESVAFQEIYRELISKSGMYATPISPRSKDKRTRLQEIVGYIEFGNIKFMPGTEDLVDQLTQFPNAERDDIVDAFVYAVFMALNMGTGFMYQPLGTDDDDDEDDDE